jgi:hypothetical protein
MTLNERIAELVEQHGGWRSAARAIRIDVGYLFRLSNGDKTSPSVAVLRRLGLRAVVNYERLRKPNVELTRAAEGDETGRDASRRRGSAQG